MQRYVFPTKLIVGIHLTVITLTILLAPAPQKQPFLEALHGLFL